MVSSRSSRVCICALTIAALGSAGRPGATSTNEDAAIVRATNVALQAAIAARDVEGTMTFYVDEAVLLPAAAPIVVGQHAIRTEWDEIFALPAFSNNARLEHIEVRRGRDLAYTRGTYATRLISQAGDEVTEVGKWVTIWRRQPDGNFRIVVDVYNTDAPPPDHL